MKKIDFSKFQNPSNPSIILYSKRFFNTPAITKYCTS